MDARDSDQFPDLSTSRRRFLLQGAGITAGTVLVPATLLVSAGCRGPVAQEQAQPAGVVLRASRFRGAPDGRPREIWGYNQQLHGPIIRAKEGETLRIKVVNDLGVPTSIHWHGIHQHQTWQMDGVEDVSRPPIPPGSEFVYEFRAEPSGTHWYHAHVGVQYGNGLFGPLIVEERTPIASYDREEVLLINDWFLELGDTILARLLGTSDMKARPEMKGTPGTIDMGKAETKAMPEMKGMPGKMEMGKADTRAMPEMKGMPGTMGMGKADAKAMPEMKGMPGTMDMGKDVGDVPFQSGLINGKGRGAGDTKTPLTVIEVKKGETVRLRLINGSSTFAFRFQVDGHPLTVIASDGSPMKPVGVDDLVIGTGERFDVLLKAEHEGIHWVRAVTLDGNEVLAVLRYAGEAYAEPEPSPVRWGPRPLTVEAMRPPGPVTLADRPRVIPLRLGGSMKPYRWSIDDQFFPKADAIVIQKDEPIRFHFRNPTGMDHPFHLHGHSFHVLGQPDALNLTDPVLKDTVNVPANSELVIEWIADNPGRWFFHCHIEWHLATGMARVLEVKPF